MNRTTRLAFVAFTSALPLVPLANGQTTSADGRPSRIVVRQRQFIEKESGRPFVAWPVGVPVATEKAGATEAIVSDAYVRSSADGMLWNIGTNAVQMTVDGRDGNFRLAGFLNKACEPALEYVDSRAAAAPLALNSAGPAGKSKEAKPVSSTDSRWTLKTGVARQVVAGGRPAVQLDLTLRRKDILARLHILAFPGTSVLRQWCEIENAGTSPLALKDFAWSIPVQGGNGPLTDHWIGDGKSPASHCPMANAEISNTYHRRMDGQKTLLNIPWVALQRSAGNRDGWFMMLEYLGAWRIGVDRDLGGAITVSAAATNLDSIILSPGDRLSLPTLTLGTFKGNLDDMAQRVYDWQYQYLWDYTHDEWYARLLFCGSDYYNKAWNSQENFAGRIGWLDMDTADLMRSLGAEVLWDDAGWGSLGEVWASGREGPDFSVTQRYLAKMGMKWTLWHLGRPPQGIMDNEAAAWGDFQWRTDGVGEFDFKADADWRDQIRHFLDANPRSSFHTCDGGSGYSHIFDIQRYTDVNYLADAGLPLHSNHCLSYFETPDKWLDGNTAYRIVKSVQDTGKYDPYGYTGIFSMAPCFGCAGPHTVDMADPSYIRRITDTYRYLRDQGVAGRWSYMLHPTVAGDAEHFYSQRLSHDRMRAMIILKHKAPAKVTIYPRGLVPQHSYDVGYESHRTTVRRTGADLMANGIILADQPPGELIYLGLPNRPRSGADTTAPTAPSRVLAHRETNIGRPGIGIYWSPAPDNNWVTCYEVRRGDRVLDRVATGTYFFDHSPGWDSGATYSVRTLDGDGNASDWTKSETISDEPLAYSALGGHSSVAGLDGWSAKTTSDGHVFVDMTFVRPAKEPFIDYAPNFQATVDQVGGLEGYWEGKGGTQVGRGWQRGSTEAQCMRVWTAPRSGSVRIIGRAMKEYNSRDRGQSLRVRMLRGEAPIWPLDGWAVVPVGDHIGCPHNVPIQVEKGDIIRFVLDKGTSSKDDIIVWMPRIEYTAEGPALTNAGAVRILCGAKKPYTDHCGNVWSADRFFTRGNAFAAGKSISDATPPLTDQALYQYGRRGKDFVYSIPVQGLSAVRLKFAEPEYDFSFERPLNLSINGREVLRNFDVCQAARGPRRAYDRVFRYLVPNADGRLVLHFSGGWDPAQLSDEALVQAIEVLPEQKTAIRVNAGCDAEFVDWSGSVWAADAHFSGGVALKSAAPVAQASPTLYDQELYRTARSGKELSYTFTVTTGLYTVHLKFAELWLAKAGQRPMDIEINSRLVRKSWDPATAAGCTGMAADVRVEGITPDKNGYITICIRAAGSNDAILQGIEIE
jgi:hypothetical protein